jgi:hypothetical protein
MVKLSLNYNIGASDYFLESGLADRQRQAPQILAVRIEKVKGASTSFVDLPPWRHRQKAPPLRHQ